MASAHTQCTARSKRSGNQCQREAILGGRVCVMHGGSAPQVREAAQKRLRELLDPAIDGLEDLLTSTIPAIQLGAIKEVIAATGTKPDDKLKIDMNTIAVQHGIDPAKLATLPDDQLNRFTDAANTIRDIIAGLRSGEATAQPADADEAVPGPGSTPSGTVQ